MERYNKNAHTDYFRKLPGTDSERGAQISCQMRYFQQIRHVADWNIKWRRTGKSENVSADTKVM